MTTQKQINFLVANFNAYHTIKIDTDSLGAGGSKKHIVAISKENSGLGRKLTDLLSRSEQWNYIHAFSSLLENTDLSLDEVDPRFKDEYDRTNEALKKEWN